MTWNPAVHLLGAAAWRFQLLGQPIEQGHTLLVLGQVERRRRRHAAARGRGRRRHHVVHPHRRQAADGPGHLHLARLAGPATRATVRSRPPPWATLTATEAGIANMVREGASNREIAARMFLR